MCTEIKGAKIFVEGMKYNQSTVREFKKVASLTFEITGGKDVMPIGCWWGPYSILQDGYPEYLTDEYFEYMVDTGINFISAVPNNIASHEEIIYKSLEFCKKYKVGYFVNDTAFRNLQFDKIKENLPKYIYDEACIGVHVFDEPYYEGIDLLKEAYGYYNGLALSDKPLYINLLPSYGKFGDDETRLEIYEKYVDDFCKKVPVKMLSYDYYAFKKIEYEWGRIKLFYANLSIVSKVAKKYNIPMWAFVQTGGQFQLEYDKNAEVTEKYPTENMLFWNVNANLLYGAKCMQYFTFIQPSSYINTKNGKDYTTIGMIGANGEKNVWYDYVKRINAWIKRIEKYLMNSTFEGVMISGDNTATLIEKSDVTDSYYELKSIDGCESVIGCFNNEGSTLLFVLNNDYEKDGEVMLHFDNEYRYEVITEKERGEYVGQNVTLSLRCGRGAVVKIL